MLVVLDTLRADRVSAYGYDRPTTIQVDQVAAAGVLFETAIAPGSWTYPNHASLFTGEPPWIHGARRAASEAAETASEHALVPSQGSVTAMRTDLPTLAEKFAKAGYRTVALAANPWLSPDIGLTRGFQDIRVFRSDETVVTAARDEIARDHEKPLFLFVNLMYAHAPYCDGVGPWSVDQPGLLDQATAPPWARDYLVGDHRHVPGFHLDLRAPGDDMPGIVHYFRGDLQIPSDGLDTLSGLYDAGVRGADFGFGRILEAWVETSPNGIIAVTSDHGEALGERRRIGHQASVYPEVLEIPMILAAPGRLPAGRRIEGPVQLHDLNPTLLDLAGIESTEGSLIPVIETGRADTKPLLAMAWRNPFWARNVGGDFAFDWRYYRRGDEALIWNRTEGARSAKLFDLTQDPGMHDDIAIAQPDRVAYLVEEASKHFVEDAAEHVAEIPAHMSERLEALGYIDH
jgi:arylsulfatase A-like enzyme